jgi:glycosyltransferase involved in cell wall biosynthesis
MVDIDRFVGRMEAARERRLLRQDERPAGTLKPGVLFDSVFRGWSGYAKSARQIAWRIAPSLHVEVTDTLSPGWIDCPEMERFNAMRGCRVSPDVPRLRFFGPDNATREDRRMVCWTMMETEIVHPDMIRLIEESFDEVWTPTRWNADTLTRSGLHLPTLVMPLGVDPLVYRFTARGELPPCTLFSTDRVGEIETPKDAFIFLSVGLPSLRKGFDVLVRAFEEAFSDVADTALVIATTHAGQNTFTIRPDAAIKSSIYILGGSLNEHEMARVYSSCDAYVSASRGEGWNLPACEAAASGLPLILPFHTAHPDVFGSEAFYFDSEGVGLFPGTDHISPWYVGMPIPILGDKSRAELVELLRLVRQGGDRVTNMAVRSKRRMLAERTWDLAAAAVGRRLLELQP